MPARVVSAISVRGVFERKIRVDRVMRRGYICVIREHDGSLTNERRY